MFTVLIRMAMFGLGVVLLLDTFLPTAQETLQVDQHTSSRHFDRDATTSRGSHSTSYHLNFFGGRTHSCSVGYSAYSSVSDGDEVIVEATKIFKTCTQITRKQNAQIVYQYGFWRIFQAVGAFFAIAGGLGWISTDSASWPRFPRMG